MSLRESEFSLTRITVRQDLDNAFHNVFDKTFANMRQDVLENSFRGVFDVAFGKTRHTKLEKRRRGGLKVGDEAKRRTQSWRRGAEAKFTKAGRRRGGKVH